MNRAPSTPLPVHAEGHKATGFEPFFGLVFLVAMFKGLPAGARQAHG